MEEEALAERRLVKELDLEKRLVKLLRGLILGDEEEEVGSGR